MREWYVIRLGRPEDHNKPHITFNEGGADPLAEEQPVAPRGARPQPRARDDRLQGLAQVQNFDLAVGGVGRSARQGGYGYHVKVVTGDKSGLVVFTTRESAEKEAENLAALNPKVMYGIFECTKVCETTEPVIVKKKFNDSGELILDLGEPQ